jgi:hypothetical protein
VAAGADFGGVDHEKQVVRVDVDPGDVVAVAAVVYGHWVERELVGQDVFGLLAPGGMSNQRKPSVCLSKSGSSARSRRVTSSVSLIQRSSIGTLLSLRL